MKERVFITTKLGFVNSHGEIAPRRSQATTMSLEGAKVFQKTLKKIHSRLVNAAKFFVVKSATDNYLSARYREQRGMEEDIDMAAIFCHDKAVKLAAKMNSAEANKSFKHVWAIQEVTA